MKPELEERRRRMGGGLMALVGLGIVLLATHRGEFWPYSTYPMFSRAGRPWRRAVVREEIGAAASERWRAGTLDALPGAACSLDDYGVSSAELNGYLDSTSHWDASRRAGLGAMFGPGLQGHTLIVYRVTPGEGIHDALATPILAVSEDGVELAPSPAEDR